MRQQRVGVPSHEAERTPESAGYSSARESKTKYRPDQKCMYNCPCSDAWLVQYELQNQHGPRRTPRQEQTSASRTGTSVAPKNCASKRAERASLSSREVKEPKRTTPLTRIQQQGHSQAQQCQDWAPKATRQGCRWTRQFQCTREYRTMALACIHSAWSHILWSVQRPIRCLLVCRQRPYASVHASCKLQHLWSTQALQLSKLFRNDWNEIEDTTNAEMQKTGVGCRDTSVQRRVVSHKMRRKSQACISVSTEMENGLFQSSGRSHQIDQTLRRQSLKLKLLRKQPTLK